MKVKKYIFEDVFKYFEVLGAAGEKNRYLKFTEFNFFTRLFISLFSKIEIYRLRKNKKNLPTIFFYSDPIIHNYIFNYIITFTKLIINNPFRGQIGKNKFNHKIYSITISLINESLIKGFNSNNDKMISSALRQLGILIKKTKIELIVITDSISPINRALIYIGRKLKIKTIEIQHAIYVSKMPLITGLGPDFVFVWGEFFKNMYLKQKIRTSNSIKILGYPFEITKKKKNSFDSKLKLYYLAQGFHLQDIKNLDILLNNAIKLKEICDKNNINFKCRLHPNSPKILLDKILPKVECTPFDEKIEDAIDNGDIFVSFNSTALIQASLQGKNCIQLKNIPVVTDDFEELGICPSFNNLNDLSKYIDELDKSNILKNYKEISKSYIKTSNEGSGKIFLNLVNEVLQNN
tara:strand:+ start:10830 stop:12047 length:1218 start_codon:yes stop_codon:yes gene_type:complete